MASTSLESETIHCGTKRGRSGSETLIPVKHEPEITETQTQKKTDALVGSEPGHVRIIHGDLCKAAETLIVQQCNCISRIPHGLSYQISKQLGADPYSTRPGIRNTAAITARPTPGTVEVLEATRRPGTRVACLYAQVGMGTSGSFSGSFGVPDTPRDRLRYFTMALDALAQIMQDPSSAILTIAMPERIGCGLGGGDWVAYKAEIERFAHKHNIHVNLYRI